MQETEIALLQELGWTDIPAWGFFLLGGLNIVVIIIVAWIVKALTGRLLDSTFGQLIKRTRGEEEKKRINTINRIFHYITSIVITLITVMVVLGELGISIAPFLAAAGVVGVAVSFGAQSLVKDYFTGFVLLLENQIRHGDFIEAGGRSGMVEEVTLRHVRLRDGEGVVHFIPNGSISSVSNYSREFAYTVVDLAVGHHANLGQVYDIVQRIGTDLRSDPAVQNKILDDIEILGVTQLGDSSIMLRVRIKVVALEQWGIKRLMLAKLRDALHNAGIEIPLPQRALHITHAESSSNSNA